MECIKLLPLRPQCPFLGSKNFRQFALRFPSYFAYAYSVPPDNQFILDLASRFQRNGYSLYASSESELMAPFFRPRIFPFFSHSSFASSNIHTISSFDPIPYNHANIYTAVFYRSITVPNALGARSTRAGLLVARPEFGPGSISQHPSRKPFPASIRLLIRK